MPVRRACSSRHRATVWLAERVGDERAGERHASSGERIERRRLDDRVAAETEMVGSVLVGHDQ